MATYRYAGPGPIEALSGGEVIRPGDEREFDEEPSWGPWDLIDEPKAETPAPAPVTPPAPGTYENPAIPLNTLKGM